MRDTQITIIDVVAAIHEALRQLVQAELAAKRPLEHVESDAPPERTAYLTIEDVVRQLRISKTTLWKLRRQGKITGFNVGSKVLFKPEDVDALVERGAPV